MARTARISLILGFLGAAGCNVNVPFDPATAFAPLNDALEAAQDVIEDSLADPRGAKPFPVIVGGDKERVFYATTLTDIRLNFPGETNDFVIAGAVGPSNLYKFEDRSRELLRPLVPSGTLFGFSTDGRYVAFVNGDPNALGDLKLLATDVFGVETRILFDPAEEEGILAGAFGNPFTDIVVNEGRIAYAVDRGTGQGGFLRVEDLTGGEPTLEIETGYIASLDLRGERLAYVDLGSEVRFERVLYRNLNEDEPVVLDTAARFGSFHRVFLTDNAVVWRENIEGGFGLSRVSQYDIASGDTRIWVDAAEGSLAGATDEHFVTEEFIEGSPERAARFIVRRFDADGRVRKLAEFRADGLAGQTAVLGDRAVWVNPKRQIVVAPLTGGDRLAFAPY